MPLKSKRMRRGTPTMTERSCSCVVRAELGQVCRTNRVDPGGARAGARSGEKEGPERCVYQKAEPGYHWKERGSSGWSGGA